MVAKPELERQAACRRCGTMRHAADACCQCCGRPLSTLTPALVRTGFMALLALVLGAVCLVMVWASGVLGEAVAGVWRPAVLVLAGLLFAAAGAMMWRRSR